MAIRVQCPNCRKTGRVPDSAMNRPVLCPACGTRHRADPRFIIPDEPADPAPEAGEGSGRDGDAPPEPGWIDLREPPGPISGGPPGATSKGKGSKRGKAKAAARDGSHAPSSVDMRLVAKVAFLLVAVGLAGLVVYLGFQDGDREEPADPVAGIDAAPARPDNGIPGAEGDARPDNPIARLIASMRKPVDRDEYDPVVSGSMRSENGVTTVERRRKSGLVEVERSVEPPFEPPQAKQLGPVLVAEPETVPGAGTLEERFPSAPEGRAAHQGPGRGETVERRVAPSMAWVGGKHGGGAGFLVREGLVATTTRAITSDFVPDLKAWFPAADGEPRGPFPVALVAFDTESDVALLAVHRGDRLLSPSFALTALDQPPRGGTSGKLLGVKNAGAPDSVGALAVTFAPRVDVPSRTAGLVEVLKTSEAGGPVIDPEGRALGMATMPHGPDRPAQFLLLEGPGNFLDRHGRDGEEEFRRAQDLHWMSVEATTGRLPENHSRRRRP